MRITCEIDRHQYQAEVEIEPDDGGYHAFCSSLRGVHTCGRTEQEAIDNATYAITAYIRSLLKHNEPVPLPCENLVIA